jgi:DNA-binding XRE family transcriptional regulator
MLSIIENMARENNIGDNIMKYRSKQGLLQEIFANKSGVKYTTLTKIESGVIKEHQFGYCENRQSFRC